MEFLLKTAVGLMIAFVVFVIADMFSGSFTELQTATVIERHYIPESTTVDCNSDGKCDTHTEPEKWRVILKLNQDVFSADAESSVWAQTEKGTQVSVNYLKGGISGGNYGWRVRGIASGSGERAKEFSETNQKTLAR